MNVFEILLFNTILLSFPYIVYLFYIYSNESITEYEKNTFFYLAIITSCFILLRFGNKNDSSFFMLLLNIPIFFGYLKNKENIGLLFSIITFICAYYFFHVNFILILNYIIGYIISKIRKKKDLTDNQFLIIFCIEIVISFIIMMIIYKQMSIESVSKIILFLLIIKIVYSMFAKGEEIMSTHIANKKLRQN